MDFSKIVIIAGWISIFVVWAIGVFLQRNQKVNDSVNPWKGRMFGIAAFLIF